MSKRNGNHGELRLINYRRVSTDEQAQYGFGLDTQNKFNLKYIASINATCIDADAEGAFEEDYTGTVSFEQRPVGKRVWQMLCAGGVDGLVVHVGSRLSRNLPRALLFIEECIKLEIEIHITTIGRVTDANDIRIVLEFWKAQADRDTTVEQLRQGRLRKAERGRWVGAGVTPYGYARRGALKEVELIFNEAEIAVVKRIQREYIENKTPLHRLAALLTLESVPPPRRGHKTSRGWYPATLRTILISRAYLGEFRYAGRVIRLPELAVIDEATHAAIMERITLNKQLSQRNRKYDYLLSGYFKCTCGRAMVGGSSMSKQERYYACSSHGVSYMLKCSEGMMKTARAEDAVWSWIVKTLDADKIRAGVEAYARRLEEGRSNRDERLRELGASITRGERQLAQLAEDLRDISGESGREAVKSEINHVSSALDALKRQRAEMSYDATPTAALDVNRIVEIADILRMRLVGGEVGYVEKRYIMDELRMQVKVEYRNGVRGLRIYSDRFKCEGWRAVKRHLNRDRRK